MRAEPLGALLASRGHITEEQLELALTEQKATGRPLGEIIVARGFAPPPTVAQALATQHGGLLKTEYGFATGWGGGVDVEQAPAQAAPAPVTDESNALRASLEEHKKALAAWQQAHKELQEKLAEAQKPAPPVDDPRLTRLAAERESMQAELTARDASIQQLQASLATVEAGRVELERALANEVERGTALRAEVAAAGASESVRAEFEQRLAGLEDEVAERLSGAAAEFESARVGLEHQLTEAHGRVASLEAEVATREAEVAERSAAPAGRWDAAQSHLVFFQGKDGYELHERSGPPPVEGSKVGRQMVARISSAPFPGSALPCAYLVA
jgi:prefoldin subunit 5